MSATNLFGTITAFIILFYSAILLPKLDFVLLQGNVKIVIVLAFLLCYFFANALKKDSQHFSFSNFDVLFLSLIAWQGISVFWCINKIEAINVTANWATLYIVFKFFQHICLNEAIRKRVTFTLISFCCISVLIAYLIIFINGSSNSSTFFFDNSATQLIKTYQLTKSYISTLFVLFFGVAIFLIVQKNGKAQWFGVLLFLLIYSIELVLKSRGGVLLSVILLCFLLVSNFYTKLTSWPKILTLSALCIALFFIVSILRTNQQDYLYLMDPLYGLKSSDGDSRLTMWKMSLQLFLEKPLLGYGSGSWLYEYMRFDYCNLSKWNYETGYFIHPHNLFLEKLSENGIVGFLLSIVFFILYPFWYFLQKLKNKTFNNYYYLWFPGIVCFALNVMLYSTLQIGWGNFKGQAFLYMFFMSQVVCKKDVKNATANKIFSYLILLVVIFLFGFYTNTSYLSHHFLKCSNYFRSNNIVMVEKHLNFIQLSPMPYSHKGFSTEYLKMKLHLKKSQFLQAEKSILKQLKHHPYNFNFWLQLGSILEEQNKFKEARNAYEKALLYNCEFIPAQIKLLNVGYVLNDEKLVNHLKNELSIIDNYLNKYYENETTYKKISKAVKQKNVFEYFKSQRDGIVNIFNVK